MGDKADNILASFALSADERKQYTTVKEKFDRYFVKKHNVIFERAKFNSRHQRKGETVDNFITDLHCLAEHCAYGELHSEMIRDRIVVGLLDDGLSEKMQLDPNLTLERAVSMARQSETVHKQQGIVRGTSLKSGELESTSVRSEEIFSVAGNILIEKRNRLLPENVDKLVFLHENMFMYA